MAKTFLLRKKGEVVDSIISGWNEWNTVSLSGKFKMSGLPLSPSMKIFMERDSSILISMRAPLMGEVGRIEIANDTILAVNKMNKTFVKEPVEKALAYYPGTISDLQDLLLGRIVVPGKGLLSGELVEALDIYSEDDGTTTIVAGEEAALPDFNYGYVVDANWFTAALMVMPLAKPDVAVTVVYEYFTNGYDMQLSYQSEKRNYKATLEFNEPEWESKGFDRTKLGGKYTQLTFDKFIKSF